MPQLTLISRLSDGLLLCASVEAMDRSLEAWSAQVRSICTLVVLPCCVCELLTCGLCCRSVLLRVLPFEFSGSLLFLVCRSAPVLFMQPSPCLTSVH
jgi:hypothetical protein